MKTNYSTTGAQESLRTRDRLEAHRLFNAKNEAERLPSVNRQIALAYLEAGDPEAPKRTWQRVMDQVVSLKKGETKRRWETAIKDRAFDELRKLTLSETMDNHLRDALNGVKTWNENRANGFGHRRFQRTFICAASTTSLWT